MGGARLSRRIRARHPRASIRRFYASQDTEAARRICDSLRAAGLEIWFDQSELRGGAAWDASIRKQAKECAHFAPAAAIVPASAQAAAVGNPRAGDNLSIAVLAFANRSNDADPVFAWLGRGYAQRDSTLGVMTPSWVFAPIHADSRWDAFLRRMGLAD